MFYHPTSHVYATPATHGYAYEEIVFPSLDGTMLSGWFVPAEGQAKGTVIHFHGNAQNMTAHFSFVSWLPASGFNVFAFDYRGYGRSAGKPDREGVHEDSCAALSYVRSRADIDVDRLLVLGQSLGGANALAALRDTGTVGIRAVAIDSAFYSYRSITRDAIAQMPLLSLVRWPLSFMVISNARSPSQSLKALPPIPLLIVHGTDDAVVPYHHAERIFDRAQEPKDLLTVPKGYHTDAFARREPTYRNELVTFFDAALHRERDQ